MLLQIVISKKKIEAYWISYFIESGLGILTKNKHNYFVLILRITPNRTLVTLQCLSVWARETSPISCLNEEKFHLLVTVGCIQYPLKFILCLIDNQYQTISYPNRVPSHLHELSRKVNTTITNYNMYSSVNSLSLNTYAIWLIHWKWNQIF